MKPIALPLLASILLQSAITAHAQAELPTDEQLRTWDAKFLPGRYSVQEFDLDAKGQPIAKTIKTREQCLSSSDMQNIARAPLTAMLLWKCSNPPAEARADST